MTYPNSGGESPATLSVPANACDSHIHIFDPRYAEVGGVQLTHAPSAATVADYRRIQQRLGTSRAIVVQPRVYGTDNEMVIAAIAELGADVARGIAVVTPDVDAATLARLHEGGIRGVRMTLFAPQGAPTRFDMIAPLARLIAPLGWHLQLHFTADQLVAHEAVISSLPCPVVFDHFARLPADAIERKHPAFDVVCRLLKEDKAWLKLSAPYLDAIEGSTDVLHAQALARTFADIAPRQLVWGSDWPHPTEMHKPDDAHLLDSLGRWIPDAATRERILVANPARLYDFDR